MPAPLDPRHRSTRESTQGADDWIGARLRAEAAAARRAPSPQLRGRILAALERERSAAALRPRRPASYGPWLAAASITALLAFAALREPGSQPASARPAPGPRISAVALQAAMFETIFSPSATVSSAASTAMRGELLALAIDSSRFADAVMDGFARPMRRLTTGR
ncbi:MAG: hypothetical protein E2O39_15680 [Planctomycetota bacterium]|nr:MAG: hypothetical protein E2O39_15680 [Planctomycetota bacterium]